MELKYEFYINAGLEEVWNALISPDGTRNSFFGSELRTNFQPGQPFAYVGPGNDGAGLSMCMEIYWNLNRCPDLVIRSILDRRTMRIMPSFNPEWSSSWKL